MTDETETNLALPPSVLEELTSTGEGTGLEVEKSEGSIMAPFDPAKIDVITQARTVDLLMTRLKEEELDLSPDFQRRSNLWNRARKSSLIESMLLRIPIPSLYVSEDSDGNYTVVDGLQRICAIAHFIKVEALNKSLKTKLDPLRLSGLQSLKDYEDKAYAELPRPLQRRISETELTLHIIRASTPQDVKFSIFSRINQGGLPLTAQEIRNAIYPGQWRNRIRGMAEGEDFITATGGKIKGERMQDIELVLRFVAHYTLAPNEKRQDDQNLDQFLNETIEKRSVLWSEETWDDIETALQRALKYAPLVFGHIAFRKYSPPGKTRAPINRGLFETESVVLALRSEPDLIKLAARSQMVVEGFRNQFETNKDFESSLLYATGRGSSSHTRIDTINGIFNGVLNA
jgi:hypothetical protein